MAKTLADQLKRIASTRGDEQTQFAVDFQMNIEGHREEKLLSRCLVEAVNGKGGISFSRKVVPPLSLREEGFHLEKVSCGYEYRWD